MPIVQGSWSNLLGPGLLAAIRAAYFEHFGEDDFDLGEVVQELDVTPLDVNYSPQQEEIVEINGRSS